MRTIFHISLWIPIDPVEWVCSPGVCVFVREMSLNTRKWDGKPHTNTQRYTRTNEIALKAVSEMSVERKYRKNREKYGGL